MSTGNYDHDNFVRVDCAASSEQFRINAIHETAHFSLIKQSFFRSALLLSPAGHPRCPKSSGTGPAHVGTGV